MVSRCAVGSFGWEDAGVECPRLAGRPVDEGDVPFILSAWNDERVTALVRETMTEDQVRERIERWRRQRAEFGHAPELFCDPATARPVGWGGLQHSTIGIGERLTIGYAVAPELWGHGFATAIAEASIAWAFQHLDVDEVRASILSTNRASRRVAEKAGLTLECELSHGEQVEVIYLIDREAWGRSRRRLER